MSMGFPYSTESKIAYDANDKSFSSAKVNAEGKTNLFPNKIVDERTYEGSNKSLSGVSTKKVAKGISKPDEHGYDASDKSIDYISLKTEYEAAAKADTIIQQATTKISETTNLYPDDIQSLINLRTPVLERIKYNMDEISNISIRTANKLIVNRGKLVHTI